MQALNAVGIYLQKGDEHERTQAILRLVEVGIPASDFEICIDFLMKGALKTQINIINELVKVGVVPSEIRSAF